MTKEAAPASLAAASPAAAPAPAIGVVGCGYWGRNLVRNFAQLGALAAITDAHGPTAQQFAAQYSVPARDWGALLADPAITGVAIAAPAAQHGALVREALAAGKDVFVEKPLALDLAEAEALCRQAESAGRVLMVGHLLQYHPAFLRLRELVSSGALGRLQYVYSNRLNLGKIRTEENILWSFAPHDISMILALVGAAPEHVAAEGAAYLHPRIADVSTTHMRFANGVRAHVFVSWLHPFKEQKLVVVGEQGMAVFEDGQPWERKLLLYRHRIEWRAGSPEPARAEGEPVVLAAEEPLRAECAHFLDCIATRARPRTDGREGLAVLRVLDAAQRSLEALVPNGAGAPAPAAVADVPAPAPEAAANPGIDPKAFVHESAYVDQPSRIGAGTRIWHFSHVLANTSIGRDCSIGQNVVLGPDVTVGDGCKIQNNVSLYKGVTLEDGVFCGPSCVFTNVVNPRAGIRRMDEVRETLVRRGATIGANATIVCGHSLGEYCFIAAGAVVTKDVPAFALMAGVPARRIGWMSRAGHRLGPDLVCPQTGARYRQTAPDRLEEIA
ncbi:MAG: Gfo/Idh/MocA family oxidoreductase [Alphaproteobacteria bacterium]|nr:Gfo/Idh/MocA family oxidoreductase [Alphaproteobacteria bacterium]